MAKKKENVSANYQVYQDDDIILAYCRRNEHIPEVTWYGTDFRLLLEHMTKIKPLTPEDGWTSMGKYIRNAFKFTATNLPGGQAFKVRFNTVARTQEVQRRYMATGLNQPGAGKIKHNNYRLFWGWGSKHASWCNMSKVDCPGDFYGSKWSIDFLHMNSDWKGKTFINLYQDQEYTIIFHKEIVNFGGATITNKPQFWAILDKDTDINDYDVSLQKYSGERYDCEQQHDHKNKHLRQATWNCAVPPETEQGC